MLVLPEDDANGDMANGFMLHETLDSRIIQVLPCAGGWPKVQETFTSDHIRTMRKYPKRHVVLLVDFNRNLNRFDKITGVIPQDLTRYAGSANQQSPLIELLGLGRRLF